MIVPPSLNPHPQSSCYVVTEIFCDAQLAHDGDLTLRYDMAAKIVDVLLPTQAPVTRADDLWQHTCFEAFIKRPGEDAYIELNLSPSHAWAAYQFEDYRQGMRTLNIPPPKIKTRRTDDRFTLTAELTLPHKAPWQIGLAAVIEERNSNISYWALAHPPGKPDFHHAHGFVYQVDVAT